MLRPRVVKLDNCYERWQSRKLTSDENCRCRVVDDSLPDDDRPLLQTITAPRRKSSGVRSGLFFRLLFIRFLSNNYLLLTAVQYTIKCYYLVVDAEKERGGVIFSSFTREDNFQYFKIRVSRAERWLIFKLISFFFFLKNYLTFKRIHNSCWNIN